MFILKKKTSFDFYRVIYPNSIAKMEKPEFGINGRLKECEYKDLLIKAYPFVEEFEKNGKLQFRECNASDIQRRDPEYIQKCNFFKTFLDSSNSINVEKMHNGKYKVVTNGIHRMYVAKKYNLKLLVHICREYK